MPRKGLARVMKLVDVELNNNEPEKAFLLDLKRSIELINQKESRTGSNSYKPSGMSCMRQMYYVRTEAETDADNMGYALVGICNNGTDTHVRIQTYISKMKEVGMDCEYVDVAQYVRSRELNDLEIVSQNGMETKLYHKDLKLSFLCDGIIKYRGINYILELKTEGNGKFYGREGVDPSHYNQATCYSLALGLDNVIFVYINRDNYEMKSYMFNVTGEMKQSIVGLITNCEDYVEKKQVPPVDNVPSKACNYCHYKTQCRKDV